MTVIGGVLLFAAGAAMGGGAVVYNSSSIRRALKGVTREKEQLRNELFHRTLDAECDKAYRKGYGDGRHAPETDAEQFARSFEGRRVSFAGQAKNKEV